MLSKIDAYFFLLLVAVTLVAFVLTLIILFVKTIISSIKSGNFTKLKYTLISILCIIVATLSWFSNFGWLRFIASTLAVPIIHNIAFIIINYLTLQYIEKSNTLKRHVVFSYITYLLGYILFPDSGDNGPMYVFFGLIHNNFISYILGCIAAVLFAGNIVSLTMQMTEGAAIKKFIKNSSINSNNPDNTSTSNNPTNL